MIRFDGNERLRALRESEEARTARHDLKARIHERARCEGELWLTGIVRSSLDAIVVAKADGRILLLNPAAERMFRCSAAQAAAQPVDRFIPFLPRRFVGGKLEHLRARRADGEEFDAAAAISDIEVAGRHLRTYIFRDLTVGPRPEDLVRTLSRALEQTLDGVFITARDISQQNRTEEALRRLNENLELQAKSIAQALHDEAGQFLTAAHIALAEVARELPPAMRERLQDVKKHLDGIEDQLRRLAHELRPRILDDLGLVPALEFLAQGVEKRRGISVAIEAAPQIRLPGPVETTIYRLAQEALTNVSKHAGAVHVTIRLEHRLRALRCTIADDGVGFDAADVVARLGEQGLGLTGIRDRLEALGGTLEINSARGRGTELAMTIPLET